MKGKIPLVEENILISSGKKKNKDGDKNIQLIRKSDTDKNDIIIELSHKKKDKQDEDEKSTNSAEFSGQFFKKEKQNKNEKAKTSRPIGPIPLSQKAFDKYTQRIKEKTMRMEIERIQKETERIKQIYEEKNSFLHLFDNNPQFQKMLKMIEKQLILIFIQGIISIIFSSIIFFYITKKKQGLALASFSLSIAEIAILVILIVTLKLGLLNDPELSKAFRLFVIIELFLLISSFIINFIIPFFLTDYLKKLNGKTIRIIIYILFVLIIIFFFLIFKYCFILFFESILILLNKKTEYSILMLNEQNIKTEINISTNMTTTSNNLTTEGLNNYSSDIFNEYQKDNFNKMTKEEEQYRNNNYFNRFHYSVTSDRKNDKYPKKKNL